MKGKARLDFFPKAPDTKAAFFDRRVVEQDHGTRGQFWQPRLKIVFDRFIGVQAIDVQEIDTLVFDVLQSFIKGLFKQGRKSTVVRFIVEADFFKDVALVVTGVLVPSPSVHRKAARLQGVLSDGLAKGEIRAAAMGTEFHQHFGLLALDEPTRKRQMPCPRGVVQVMGLKLANLRQQVREIWHSK